MFFSMRLKKSLILPVPEVPLKVNSAEDLRPRNLLTTVENILEIFVNEQLVNYFEINNFTVEEQSGFRKKHSCETAINFILNDWT